MFKINGTFRSRGEQNDIGIFPMGRNSLRHSQMNCLEKGSQPTHLGFAIEIRKDSGENNAVFQRITKPRRARAVFTQHPELPIRVSIEISSIAGKKTTIQGLNAMAGTQKCWVRVKKFRWQKFCFQQLLRPIHICQYVFKQPHPLDKTGLKRCPFPGCQGQGHNIQVPGCTCPLLCIKRIVGGPVFMSHA